MGLVSEAGNSEVVGSRGLVKVCFEDCRSIHHWQAGALQRMGVDMVVMAEGNNRMARAQGIVVLVAWSMGSLAWAGSIG